MPPCFDEKLSQIDNRFLFLCTTGPYQPQFYMHNVSYINDDRNALAIGNHRLILQARWIDNAFMATKTTEINPEYLELDPDIDPDYVPKIAVIHDNKFNGRIFTSSDYTQDDWMYFLSVINLKRNTDSI